MLLRGGLWQRVKRQSPIESAFVKPATDCKVTGALYVVATLEAKRQLMHHIAQ